jgi:twitching motility two-component system response regulator PilH
MSTTTAPTDGTEPTTSQPEAPGWRPQGVERRRRKRAKISAQVHVRAVNSPTAFEEICKSVDVSRDGLLFVSSHSGYWKGQPLEIIFPYSTAACALNQVQATEVARVYEYGQGLFGVGVQFVAAKGARQDHSASPASPGTTDSSSVPQKLPTVVLAIEPDERVADNMRNLLQQDGYTVVIVPNGQAALDVLKTTVPAVFLTEVENSDISGHDLCMIIKKNERLQPVPVILLSQSTQPADYSSSQQLGAVVCMAKPFDPGRLLQLVRLVAPPPVERSAYGAPVQASAIERTL